MDTLKNFKTRGHISKEISLFLGLLFGLIAAAVIIYNSKIEESSKYSLGFFVIMITIIVTLIFWGDLTKIKEGNKKGQLKN